MNTLRPQGIELLSLRGTVDEAVLAALLRKRLIPLRFNGSLVWGLVNDAIWKARQDLAQSAALSELDLVPRSLDIAAYHTEEEAIYVGIVFEAGSPNSDSLPRTYSAEVIIRKGSAQGEFTICEVGRGTSAKLLIYMEAIDLTKVLTLPYSADQ